MMNSMRYIKEYRVYKPETYEISVINKNTDNIVYKMDLIPLQLAKDLYKTLDKENYKCVCVAMDSRLIINLEEYDIKG